MGKTKVRVNSAGANAFRKSAEVKADLQSRAQRIMRAAEEASPEPKGFEENPGYAVDMRDAKQRAYAYVIAANPITIADNGSNNTLLRALDAGR